MILTLQTLIDKGACPEQVDLFRRKFGHSVNVTIKLCLSVSDKFQWDWAVRHLLSPAARAEYDRVTAPALAEYGRVAARAFARAEYDRVTAPALAEYERVAARAFALAYNGRKQS